jgi:hypothetical protein
MTDVELEIIDLSTGSSLGKVQLDICVPMELELNVGSYRFRATYLKTGEVQEADRNIVEVENPPLEFTFAAPPPPITHTLTIDSTPVKGIPFTIERVS